MGRRLLLLLSLMVVWGGMVLTFAGFSKAAGPFYRSPDYLYKQARERAAVLDSKARLVLAAYKLGNEKGLFEQGVFVYHSPGLERAGGRWNCYMVVTGRSAHYNQIRLAPPKSELPEINPEKPLHMAWDWVLGYWWKKQKKPYLNVVLRPAQKKENLPRTCKWVWEFHALSLDEECLVFIDALKMRRLRANVINGPDPTPPPAYHFK
ncbi:hypothetical protein [Dethiosulfatarculus sandiegensis]|uniref:hypothetical protein n=1 Tax=Dethiosulfatarculus sandiegensis TaxID=1429043 RepID=UPI0012E284FA|nr:hypothetical protein [Dethiosulfatarculus sandiegensis]